MVTSFKRFLGWQRPVLEIRRTGANTVCSRNFRLYADRTKLPAGNRVLRNNKADQGRACQPNLKENANPPRCARPFGARNPLAAAASRSFLHSESRFMWGAGTIEMNPEEPVYGAAPRGWYQRVLTRKNSTETESCSR